MTEINKLYECYGRFAIKFEKTCGAIEILIDKILEIEGLKRKETRDIILAGLTAEPIRSLAQSLVGEYLKPSKEDEKIISSIFTQFQELTSKRNVILHSRLSTWSITNGEKHTAYATGYKLHKTKKGETNKDLEYSSESIIELHDEATNIFNSICCLRQCIENGNLLKNAFIRGQDGAYQVSSNV